MLRRVAIVLCIILPAGQYASAAQAGPGKESAQRDKPLDVRIDWLKKHAIAVRTIDPKDDDFTSLDKLADTVLAKHKALGIVK